MRFYGILAILLAATAINVAGLDTSIDIELASNGNAREIINVGFVASQDADEIVYSLINKPENLVAYDNRGELVYEITKNEYYDILIKKRVLVNDNIQLKLEFDIDGLVENFDGKNVFSFRFQPDDNVNEFNFNLKLPKGYILADIESSVSPSGYDIVSDGRYINLNWKFNNLESEQSFIVVYERGFSKVTGWVISFTIVFAGLVIYGVNRHYKKKHKTIFDKTLSLDEKKIKEIIEKAGETTQKQVVKETGYSKAKVSKIIRRLEEKEVVEKKPWMATNKLKIRTYRSDTSLKKFRYPWFR